MWPHFLKSSKSMPTIGVNSSKRSVSGLIRTAGGSSSFDCRRKSDERRFVAAGAELRERCIPIDDDVSCRPSSLIDMRCGTCAPGTTGASSSGSAAGAGAGTDALQPMPRIFVTLNRAC